MLADLIWKPISSGKQHYMVIESKMEFCEYDEDMETRSKFWRTLFEEDIAQNKKISDKPPMVHNKLYLDR